uniref:NADH-ubiquinone oxidoreductase chain 4 n=1 Tax=Psychomyia kalais TaxID=2904897 RepID=A0A9E8LPC8_9NEOP|nr:NADH dehydrogenase subunit 4 [Psychomyia kalais]UZZ44346.1 NADH dehydrogenase subunit 4 [Psychomyia kalais]
MLKLLFFFFFFFFLLNNKKSWFFMNMLIYVFLMMLLMNFSIMNFFNISMMFSLDILSLGLSMLSIWIVMMMIMVSETIYYKKNNLFFFMMNNLLLLLMLLLVFLSMNIFYFYFFFEVSLLPVLFLILGWGYQVERIQAGVYLLFYTLVLSLPMLLVLITIFNKDNYLMIYMINNHNMFIVYFILMMSFLVKMPMFGVHLWLLKAHVESPVSGSMILAGLMLKLGGFGLMRLMKFFSLNLLKLNFYFIILSLLGGVYLALMCLMQLDLKLLIAMSSIVHMSMVISGIFIMNNFGFSGSYLMMLGHGLCSSGLFLLSNLCYERFMSRSMVFNKGIINFLPLLSLWWFLLVSSNMASPPSMNLLSEISLMISILSFSFYLIFILILLSFFSAVYNLYLYSFSQHGYFMEDLLSFNIINIREYLSLFLHWFPLNFMILLVDFVFMLM